MNRTARILILMAVMIISSAIFSFAETEGRYEVIYPNGDIKYTDDRAEAESLVDKEVLLGKYTTDKDGKIVLKNWVKDSEIRVEEIKIPDGYTAEKTEYEANISDGSLDVLNEVVEEKYKDEPEETKNKDKKEKDTSGSTGDDGSDSDTHGGIKTGDGNRLIPFILLALFAVAGLVSVIKGKHGRKFLSVLLIVSMAIPAMIPAPSHAADKDYMQFIVYIDGSGDTQEVSDDIQLKFTFEDYVYGVVGGYSGGRAFQGHEVIVTKDDFVGGHWFNIRNVPEKTKYKVEYLAPRKENEDRIIYLFHSFYGMKIGDENGVWDVFDRSYATGQGDIFFNATTEHTIKVKWDDEGYEDLRPKEVLVGLKLQGDDRPEEPDYYRYLPRAFWMSEHTSDSFSAFTVSKDDGFERTFSGLVKYNNQEPYLYSAKGEDIPFYDKKEETVGDTTTITYTMRAKDLSGEVTWEDGEHDNSKEIELVLKRESEKEKEHIVLETPEWNGSKYTYSNLEMKDSEGNPYKYWVEERIKDEKYVPETEDKVLDLRNVIASKRRDFTINKHDQYEEAVEGAEFAIYGKPKMRDTGIKKPVKIRKMIQHSLPYYMHDYRMTIDYHWKFPVMFPFETRYTLEILKEGKVLDTYASPYFGGMDRVPLPEFSGKTEQEIYETYNYFRNFRVSMDEAYPSTYAFELYLEPGDYVLREKDYPVFDYQFPVKIKDIEFTVTEDMEIKLKDAAYDEYLFTEENAPVVDNDKLIEADKELAGFEAFDGVYDESRDRSYIQTRAWALVESDAKDTLVFNNISTIRLPWWRK